MFSKMLAFALLALSAVSAVPTGSDTSTHNSEVAKFSAPSMVPGLYLITQKVGNRTVQARQPEGKVFALPAGGITLPVNRDWLVRPVGGDRFNIVSPQFHTFAWGPIASIDFNPRITLTKDKTDPSTVWAIDNAGDGEWIIKSPNRDTVWKYNNKQGDHTISLERSDGTPDERWVFTPIFVAH